MSYNHSHYTLLDSAASVHVFHDKERFTKFRRPMSEQKLLCGGGYIPIEGWGEVSLPLRNGNQRSILTLKRVAFISKFPLNLVSLACIEDQGFDWTHRSGEVRNRKTSRTIGYTVRRENNFEIGEKVGTGFGTVLAAFSSKSSQHPHSHHDIHSAASPDIWHQRMGHIGPLGLYKLGKECLGVRLRGKKMSQCTHCAVSKITQQISRRPPANQALRPFYRVFVDWFDLDEGWDGYQGDGAIVRRVMAVVCEATGMAITYFTETAKEDENLPLMKDFVTWLALRHNLEVKVIRSDNEMNRIKTKAWCNDVGITFEACAPDTHAQNGGAERFGRLIMEKARAMRLSANLPHKLWREIVAAATYLYNRTPRASINWKSPYEAFHTYVYDKEEVSGPRKPLLHHLKAYGCKCYVLIKSKGDPQYLSKRRKLDAKAHIGFLVGYESTNIYRVWVPHKKKVISVRDVMFDEDECWDGKRIRISVDDIKELDEAIEIVEVPQSEEMEDLQLGEDPEVESSSITRQADHEAENLEADPHEIDKQVEDEDLEWSQRQYPTPDPSVLEAFLANSVSIPVQPEGVEPSYPDSLESEGVGMETEPELEFLNEDMLEPAVLDELETQQNQRFFDFRQFRVPSKIQKAFAAGVRIHRRNLPPVPVNYRQLKGHSLEQQFRENMAEHMRQHREQFKSWSTVSSHEAVGHQVLGCQWVFVYKTDKHGNLKKCKARLVVCGNQQARCDLPTRATTLAVTSLRVLLAIAAKFDLETLQLDAVNAFVHADLDETVFMRMPPGYTEPGKVLRLNKALYGLRGSPILWQKMLTSQLKSFAFTEIPQEPCVVQKDGVICFFYVDDIVFAFKKEKSDEVKRVVDLLSQTLTIEVVGELKWFLGLHIIRHRPSQKLWLSQKAYIQKITSTFAPVEGSIKLPLTPMETTELLPIPADAVISSESRTSYQRKIGSLLFAAIATRPDIAFAVSRLSRFNQQPGPQHHKAADRVFHYLYRTQDYCIRYGGDARDLSSFICSSDASFADNTLDRKSSQGYIMKLFGGAVAWRANKQDTVTTSSTEAELLAISQTAKETIYLSRLMKALTLHIPEALTVECDNAQTIRLLVSESTKLQTKLRHVDIHSHWLRQEVQRKTIHIRWVPTKKMAADGLTKPLTTANFEVFVGMTGIEDKKDLLALIKKEEELRETLVQQKSGPEYSAAFGYGADINRDVGM